MIFWVTWALLMMVFVSLVIGVIVLIFLSSRLCWKKLKDKLLDERKEAKYASLGETLKGNRVRCKMAQEFVAEALEVSRQAVSKWENNTSEPSMANLIALAKLYEISVNELTNLRGGQK